jgi:hypothetical protein
MSYNGSGTFNINSTGQPVVAGTIISAATFNALTADLATGLTTALTKDGQTTATARIPFAQGINSTLVTDASSTSTGSIITAGGVGIAKKLYVGTDANIAGTLAVTGVATYSAQPIFSSLTASSAVATDASKGLVSVTNTGTGSNVLATSPTLVTPALGTPSSGTLSSCTVDGTDAVGFRNIPQNSQSAAYTLVLADAGKHIFHPSTDANARTFTIPDNGSVAYPIGTAITFINMTAAVVTIAITTDTMYLSSAGTTGSRSLAQYGSATAIKMTSTTWLISGSGLT